MLFFLVIIFCNSSQKQWIVKINFCLFHNPELRIFGLFAVFTQDQCQINKWLLHVVNKRTPKEKNKVKPGTCSAYGCSAVLSCSLSTSSDSREGYCLSMIKTTRSKSLCLSCFFFLFVLWLLVETICKISLRLLS